MIVKIKHIAVLQTGKLLAILYGCFAAIMVPFVVIGMIADAKAAAPMLIMIVLYPLMGFVGGVIAAAVYNLSARFVGGFEMTLEETEGPTASAPAAGEA